MFRIADETWKRVRGITQKKTGQTMHKFLHENLNLPVNEYSPVATAEKLLDYCMPDLDILV
jgi:hypothetical protein